MADAVVGIVMGSDSDWPLVKKACETLDKFGVGYETRVISAHRTPDVAIEYSKTAESRGLKVIIAAAGGAAHLGGVLAAATTVAVGSAGPTNAALLAVQILGTADAGLREKFRAHKEELRAKVAAANDRIHQA